MKRITLITAILYTGYISAQTVNIEVSMSGFKNKTGKVKVGLYNAEGTFLKTTFKSITSSIDSNKTIVNFEGLEKGEYAVSIYHDENENDTLDANIMGIPKEDFASSNNAKGFMGPPKYKDAKFTVNENTKIEIKLNN
jgi:uncharacterized protein (DUF2141 family)